MTYNGCHYIQLILKAIFTWLEIHCRFMTNYFLFFWNFFSLCWFHFFLFLFFFPRTRYFLSCSPATVRSFDIKHKFLHVSLSVWGCENNGGEGGSMSKDESREKDGPGWRWYWIFSLKPPSACIYKWFQYSCTSYIYTIETIHKFDFLVNVINSNLLVAICYHLPGHEMYQVVFLWVFWKEKNILLQ